MSHHAIALRSSETLTYLSGQQAHMTAWQGLAVPEAGSAISLHPVLEWLTAISRHVPVLAILAKRVAPSAERKYQAAIPAKIQRFRQAQSQENSKRADVPSGSAERLSHAYVTGDVAAAYAEMILLWHFVEGHDFEVYLDQASSQLIKTCLDFWESMSQHLLPPSDKEVARLLRQWHGDLILFGRSFPQSVALTQPLGCNLLHQKLVKPLLLEWIEWLDRNAPPILFADKQADAVTFLREQVDILALESDLGTADVSDLVEALVQHSDPFFKNPDTETTASVVGFWRLRLEQMIGRMQAQTPFESGIDIDRLLLQALGPVLDDILDRETAFLHPDLFEYYCAGKLKDFFRCLLDLFDHLQHDVLICCDRSGTLQVVDPHSLYRALFKLRFAKPTQDHTVYFRKPNGFYRFDAGQNRFECALPPENFRQAPRNPLAACGVKQAAWSVPDQNLRVAFSSSTGEHLAGLIRLVFSSNGQWALSHHDSGKKHGNFHTYTFHYPNGEHRRSNLDLNDRQVFNLDEPIFAPNGNYAVAAGIWNHAPQLARHYLIHASGKIFEISTEFEWTQSFLFDTWGMVHSTNNERMGAIILNDPGQGWEDSHHGGFYFSSIPFELDFPWDTVIEIDAEHALMQDSRSGRSAILHLSGRVIQPENAWVLNEAEVLVPDP